MTTWRLLLILMLAVNAVAAGQVVVISGTDLEFKQPVTWTKEAAPGKLYAAQDASGQSGLSVSELPNANDVPVDNASFLRGIKTGLTSQAAKDGLSVAILKEGPLTINAVPFYEVQGVFNAETAHPAYFHSYVTAANDKFYLFAFLSTAAESDAAIQETANSVTFKNPPVIPHRVSQADRWAKTIGETIGILLVVYLFYRYRTRKS